MLAPESPGRSHMTIMMPASDHAVLNRRDAIVAALQAIESDRAPTSMKELTA